MENPLELATAIAAIISAVGGAAAAYAAFLSAKSARDATDAAAATSKQASLREVSRTAASIVFEATALKVLCDEMIGAIKSSMVFSGVSQSSGHEILIRNTQDTARKLDPMIEDAQLFTGGARTLSDVPPIEIDRVGHRLWETLEGLRALRNQSDAIYNRIDGQNAQYRSRALNRLPGA